MSCFKVSSFLGCISLRSGGLIIAYFTLLFDVVSIFVLNGQLIPSVLHLFVTCLMLYGIYNKSHAFILPSIIFDVFIFLLNMLFILLLFPLVLIYWSDAQGYVFEYLKDTFHISSQHTKVWFIILWTVYTIIVFIRLYFSIVVYNLRKSFKSNNQSYV